MSRSNSEVRLTSPATKFIEWNSEKGQFKYWDKVNKVNVDLPLPVRFYVLDELATIKGFNDKSQSGIFSNEIKSTTKQTLKVMTKGKDNKVTTIAEGLYADIKDLITAAGGKYTRSLYVAMLNDEDEYEIVNFQLKGAAFSGWMDFVQNTKTFMSDEVYCDDFKKEKKGATKYTVPVFGSETASEEGNAAAMDLDVQLQDYLREYFIQNAEKDVAGDTADNANGTKSGLPKSFAGQDDVDAEDAPFK